MPQVYLDPDGAVRSANSHKVIAPPGTTPRQARIRAALWAAAADVLSSPRSPGSPRRAEQLADATPISAAPSYARTVSATRDALAVIDVRQLHDETAAALAAITAHQGEVR